MKNRIASIFVALCAMFFYVQGLSAQCTQPNLVNGGFENGVAAGAWGGFASGTGGWISAPYQVEYWGTGHNGVPAYEGSNFSELNSTGLATYYQDVATVPGQTYNWSIVHRGRSQTNSARIEFGPVAGPFASTLMTSPAGAWAPYNGAYTATEATTRIRLVAVDSDAGCSSCGNLLDALTFTLPDADGDGAPDYCDNCIGTANTDQADFDGDGIGDECDNCTETANADQADGDGDLIGDVCDACPTINDPNCTSCGNGKYLVCHLPAGNPENAQQLCLPYSGAESHIGNHGGCYWGACGEANIATRGNAGIDPMSSNDHAAQSAQEAGSPLIETENGYTYYFDVTPNPASDVINIHVHGLVPGAHLYVRDQFGRFVLSQQLDVRQAEFAVSLRDGRFSNGMHYVTVVTNGEMITRQLMVVK